MKRIILFVIPFLAGCWPYIPNGGADYLRPEEVDVVGIYSAAHSQGGYWTDNRDTIVVRVGWASDGLASPEIFANYQNFPEEAGCSGQVQWPTDLFEHFSDPGAESLGLSGAGTDFDALWSPNIEAFGADITNAFPDSGAPVALAKVETSEAGAWASEAFFETAVTGALNGPDFDTEEPRTMSLSDLEYTWDKGDFGPRDAVGVSVYLMTNGNIIDEVVCRAEIADESLIVEDLFERYDEAEVVLVESWTSRESWGELNAGGTMGHTVSLARSIGAYYIE